MIPRSEHPNPQMLCGEWMNINGIWEFEIDAGASGRVILYFGAVDYHAFVYVNSQPPGSI